MKWLESRIFWGLLLVAAGVLFLLDSLNVFKGGSIFWGILLGVVGVMFVATYVSNRTQWWALIPGVTLVFLSGMIIVEAFIPQVSEALGGVLVLGGVGVSFLVVYLANRANWWALIPAGVMMTLAVVSVMGNLYGDRYETGGVFFLGLGLTFLLVALLPNPQGSMKWAYIPAVILGIMGVLLLATAAPLVNYFWPIALILVGAVLFVRTLLSRNS